MLFSLRKKKIENLQFKMSNFLCIWMDIVRIMQHVYMHTFTHLFCVVKFCRKTCHSLKKFNWKDWQSSRTTIVRQANTRVMWHICINVYMIFERNKNATHLVNTHIHKTQNVFVWIWIVILGLLLKAGIATASIHSKAAQKRRREKKNASLVRTCESGTVWAPATPHRRRNERKIGRDKRQWGWK